MWLKLTAAMTQKVVPAAAVAEPAGAAAAELGGGLMAPSV
jgi:hypothetical protein